MLRVVCLCADWCSACRAWQPDWAALAARHPQLRWQWLDIEDEAGVRYSVDLARRTVTQTGGPGASAQRPPAPAKPTPE